MTMSAVLSWGLTPFSGSFKLERGPTDLVVRLGIAAAKILVRHIHIATLRDRASLRSRVRQWSRIVGSRAQGLTGWPSAYASSPASWRGWS